MQKHRLGRRDVLLKRETGRFWRKWSRRDEQGGGKGCTVGGELKLIGGDLANGEEARTLGVSTIGAPYRPTSTERNTRTSKRTTRSRR